MSGPKTDTPIELSLKSIGVFESSQVEPYQAGRQPDQIGQRGRIRLHSGFNFEQALTDLGGCSHIWIIFGFHRNTNWKPLVQTPRSQRKIGVFATRAPYRPNPLGLSLVRVIDIENLTIEVSENDILNGSPIYDIKPYHPESDVAEEASVAWLKEDLVEKNDLRFSPLIEAQLEFLESNGVPEIRPFILRQLEYDPTNSKKKRVEEKNGLYILAYRTWRIHFTHSENTVGLISVESAYRSDELTEDHVANLDAYKDKKIHILFNKEFF